MCTCLTSVHLLQVPQPVKAVAVRIEAAGKSLPTCNYSSDLAVYPSQLARLFFDAWQLLTTTAVWRCTGSCGPPFQNFTSMTSGSVSPD